jgi:hypothetical protein
MRLLGVLLLAAVLSVFAAAQTPSSELIQRLVDRVGQLERRVAELEAERAAAPAPSVTGAPAVAGPAAVTSPAPPASVQTQPTMPGMARPPLIEEGAAASRPTLQLAGFGDIDFAASNDSKTHSGFSEGQFILHFSSQLSRKVSYFGELSLTARSDAGTGSAPAPGFNVEVERSIIRYEVNDLLKVSFGRYHTPINYWNTAFHHGAWLQTTVSRPEMTQFGGSFLPVHFVGTLVEGTTPAGGLNLTYNAGVGNGRGGVISRGGDFGDINNNRAWLLNAFVRPDNIYGLQVGASLYHDRVNPIGLPAVDEWIQSAHVVWDRENPEIIAEFANVSHQPADGRVSSNSQAWYSQIAYRLSPLDHKLKPYFRYEYIHIPKSDAMFRAVAGLSGSTLGFRYDLSPFSALKLEYRHFRRPNVPAVDGFVGQTSFTF